MVENREVYEVNAASPVALVVPQHLATPKSTRLATPSATRDVGGGSGHGR
jgi:hypothetical protein